MKNKLEYERESTHVLEHILFSVNSKMNTKIIKGEKAAGFLHFWRTPHTNTTQAGTHDENGKAL